MSSLRLFLILRSRLLLADKAIMVRRQQMAESAESSALSGCYLTDGVGGAVLLCIFMFLELHVLIFFTNVIEWVQSA